MDTFIIDTLDMQLTQAQFLVRLLVATGIGFIIGLEREHSALEKKEDKFAGIRTFIILSMLGFVGACMHFLLGPWVFALVLFSVILLTSVSYYVIAVKGNIGGTSEVSGITVVLLGALSFLGYFEISLAITVIMVVLLSSKLKMQEVIGDITHNELYDFIRFVVIALLIFPFLPNETYGPYDVINPREIGWVVLLTSGLGLVGYVLMKFMGAGRGILLSGIMGGLVSSTMTTWVFSKKSKEAPEVSAHCAVAILAASSIMIIRVGIWVIVFNKSLFAGLAPAIGLVFAAAIGITLFFFFRSKKQSPVNADIPLGKPLNIAGALFFGALYTGILFVVAYASEFFGEGGIYVTSAIAGLSDVDAITISVSKLAEQTISAASAQNAILIATLANTIVKFGISVSAGSKELRKYLAIGYGVIMLAGIAALSVLYFF